jgi:hypothetical protein
MRIQGVTIRLASQICTIAVATKSPTSANTAQRTQSRRTSTKRFLGRSPRWAVCSTAKADLVKLGLQQLLQPPQHRRNSR